MNHRNISFMTVASLLLFSVGLTMIIVGGALILAKVAEVEQRRPPARTFWIGDLLLLPNPVDIVRVYTNVV